MNGTIARMVIEVDAKTRGVEDQLNRAQQYLSRFDAQMRQVFASDEMLARMPAAWTGVFQEMFSGISRQSSEALQRIRADWEAGIIRNPQQMREQIDKLVSGMTRNIQTGFQARDILGGGENEPAFRRLIAQAGNAGELAGKALTERS